MLGENFTFTCEVTIANDIAETLSYTLIRNENAAPLEEPFTVSFQPLTLADAGVYQCSVVISSPYLNNDIIITTDPEEFVLNFQSELLCVIVESGPLLWYNSQ